MLSPDVGTGVCGRGLRSNRPTDCHRAGKERADCAGRCAGVFLAKTHRSCSTVGYHEMMSCACKEMYMWIGEKISSNLSFELKRLSIVELDPSLIRRSKLYLVASLLLEAILKSASPLRVEIKGSGYRFLLDLICKAAWQDSLVCHVYYPCLKG